MGKKISAASGIHVQCTQILPCTPMVTVVWANMANRYVNTRLHVTFAGMGRPAIKIVGILLLKLSMCFPNRIMN